MTPSIAPRFQPLRVRLNVNCEGSLVALTKTGAVLQLPIPQAPERQTTVILEWNGEKVCLPARVMRSDPSGRESTRTAHHVAVEFLELAPATQVALGRIIDRHSDEHPTSRDLRTALEAEHKRHGSMATLH